MLRVTSIETSPYYVTLNFKPVSGCGVAGGVAVK
jgi:hypothetical protein